MDALTTGEIIVGVLATAVVLAIIAMMISAQRPTPTDLPDVIQVFHDLFGRGPPWVQYVDSELDELREVWILDGFGLIEVGRRNGFPLLVMVKMTPRGRETRAAVDFGSTRVWSVLP